MNRLNFLIILCGLPGSGKSSFSQLLKKIIESDSILSNNKLLVEIIDFDEIRYEEFGKDFFPEYETKIRNSALESIKKNLANNRIVISDDINYYTSMRNKNRQIAENLGLPYFIIYINTPLEMCLKWNKERGTKIPDNIIEEIANKLDIPGKKYAWDKPLIIIDLSTENLNNCVKNSWNLIQKELDTLNINKLKMIEQKNANIGDFEKIELFTKKIVNYLIKILRLNHSQRKYTNYDEFIKIILNESDVIINEFNEFDEFDEIFEYIKSSSIIQHELITFLNNFSENFSIISKSRKNFMNNLKTNQIDIKNFNPQNLATLLYEFLQFLNK